MRKSNIIISTLLVVAMLLSGMSFAFADTATEDTLLIAPAPAAKDDKIVILYTNDVHCGIDENLGYAGLAAHKAAKLAETDYVTLVDAGDAIQGAAIGTLSNGQYLADIMENVGYDIAVPGNHEFDYGMDNFLKIAKEAPYTYICSNFIDLKTGEPVFDAYKIIEYGDVSVAYVGIDTPETFVKSTPTYFQDGNGNYIYDFCNDTTGAELYANVQASVDAAAAAGADYVIAVGHLGIDAESAPWRSTDVIANTTGIDAFIDGHSHSTIAGDKVKNKAGEEVVLTSTGTKLAAIGEMTIKDGVITTQLITEVEKDAATTSYIDGIKAGYEALLNQVVAKTDVALTIKGADGQRAVRKAETNLGDLCADAYRTLLDADVAFVNGGGVRADIDVGDITYEEIIAVHPFGNAACKIEATGQQIIDALELGASAAPGENGGFLQVSGLTYKINTDIKSGVVTDENGAFVKVEGDRRVQDVKVAGEPIQLDKVYTLASHNFMLKSGGDGFTMFMGNKVLLDEVMIDNQVLINYIVEELGGVVGAEYAKPQGRISYTDNLPFTDLKGYSWARDDIKYVYDNNLFKGTGATTFGPATPASRGMVVTVLDRATDKGDLNVTEPTFSDVKLTAYYGPSVEWAAANGIVKGRGLTTVDGVEMPYYAPDAPMTRGDLASVLYTFTSVIEMKTELKDAELDFSDADKIKAYQEDGVKFCVENGIMNGYPDGTFKPNGTVTRVELAVIMNNIADYMAAYTAAQETAE